ncbi:GNAT family N-acetyltransferase [Flavobacterium sp.]|uniref:GNAT family N-acetyltransferase n=1 Tax=Flavobacterium sp. TaxID=239 RepID=UPI0026318EDA|nr:GNAT family N-acetyltransferase [Flavobacterium sp.]
MTILSEITFKDTFPVRHAILRAGKPIETCFFGGDDLPTTKHFGIFVNKKIMGVVSVFQNKNNTFNTDNQYQIRGMAVLNEAQKLGFGKQLVMHCETYVSEQKGSLIWFNAREKATLFYEKQGYEKVGNPFLIADIGLHYLMFKKVG